MRSAHWHCARQNRGFEKKFRHPAAAFSFAPQRCEARAAKAGFLADRTIIAGVCR